jgi:hypothetical protein
MRAGAGLTAAQLGKQIGRSRADISRLENGHVVDQADVLKILDALEVDGNRWTQIMTIAREAGEKGWWESYKTMGDRQAMYANLEAGATSIRQYDQTLIPGLLQTPEFARARTGPAAGLGPAMTGTPEGIAAGRLMRQRMFRRPGGPTLEAIVDEVAIRRLAAPPEVVRQQLYHVATVVKSNPKITFRVLPVDARIENFAVPRASFSIYHFADPGDPAMAVITTNTTEIFLTEPGDVTPYERLFIWLSESALPEDESLHLLAQTTAGLGGG